MKTLIIPDVHEKNTKLAALLNDERLRRVGRIVFLGDWFDTFEKYDPARLNSTIEFLMAAHQLNGLEFAGRLIPIDWILGNHDVHYFFDNDGYGCSGRDPRKKEMIQRLIPKEVIQRFQLFTYVGPYLVSHAGFHPTTIGWANNKTAQETIKASLEGHYSTVFGAGRARGGYQDIGGPTWLDWNREFEDIPGKPQIVGHTHGAAVRTKGDLTGGFKSWCIDCGLRFVAVVDEESGELQIEATE